MEEDDGAAYAAKDACDNDNGEEIAAKIKSKRGDARELAGPERYRIRGISLNWSNADCEYGRKKQKRASARNGFHNAGDEGRRNGLSVASVRSEVMWHPRLIIGAVRAGISA